MVYAGRLVCHRRVRIGADYHLAFRSQVDTANWDVSVWPGLELVTDPYLGVLVACL